MSDYHYKEDWPDVFTDLVFWDDDVYGEVEEWLEYLVEACWDEGSRTYARNNPAHRFYADLTCYVSMLDQWGESADDIAYGLVEGAELGELVDTENIRGLLEVLLTVALAKLPKEEGWYMPDVNDRAYVTAGEVLA